MERSEGFALPLVTALIVVFAGAWLNYTPEDQSLRDMRRAQYMHQEFLFWHQGVLNYRNNHGYWPATLVNLTASYSLPPVPDWLTGYESLGSFSFVMRGVSASELAHFYEPLEFIAEYTNNELRISLPAPQGVGASSTKILRNSTQAVTMEVALTLNQQPLFNVGTLGAATADSESIKINELTTTNFVIGELTASGIYGDDVIASGVSLNQLSASATALYQGLWDCMYVSRFCLEGSSTF